MDWGFDLFDTEVTHARTQGFCKIVCGSVCYNMDKSHVRIFEDSCDIPDKGGPKVLQAQTQVTPRLH